LRTRLLSFIGIIILLIVTGIIFYPKADSSDTIILTKSRNTIAYFPNQTIDLGTIKVNKSNTINIPFENRGENGLTIYNVVPECGCSVPEWPLRPIPPGAKETIKVTFTASGSGYFNKVLSIFANNSKGPIIIHITGNAKPDIH
jgi:hypothetical protein